MTNDLHLIVCGTKEEPLPLSAPARAQTIRPDLAAVSVAQCRDLLLNTSSKFLGFTRPIESEAVTVLEHAVQRFQDQPALNIVLFFPQADARSLAAWQNAPARLGALRENVAHRLAAVLLRTAALKERGFHDVSAPVWDLVIRISQSPDAILALPLEAEAPMAPPLPDLAPAPPDQTRNWLRTHLESLSPKDLAPAITSAPDGIALKAGLLQIHDYLDASHEHSQSIEGRGRNSAGDYWHAIMHRREPDYSNSKYWFRNVGSHPIFVPLAKTVEAFLSQTNSPASQTARQKLLSKDRWDPIVFVDFCQECNRGGDPELTQIAQRIQWEEMQLLLDQTYQDATS